MRSVLVYVTSTLLLGACLTTGCGGSSTEPTPGIQPQVVNMPDDFAYQVSSVQNFTGSSTFTWQNSGIAANVNQSTSLTAGNISLVITDANGTQVYSRSLGDNGTFVTANGVPGAWTVRVSYISASATVNFRAQKKT